LFERRVAFRSDDDRKRQQAFGQYIFTRRREVGVVDRGADQSEVSEMVSLFTELQPLIVGYEASLAGERPVNSVLQGETNHHYFGLSIGGINVQYDLEKRGAVDPETMAAIHAQQVSLDMAADFVILEDGKVSYKGEQIKLYSPKKLTQCFKDRERLVLQSRQR